MNLRKNSFHPRSQYRVFLGITAFGFLCLATAISAVQGTTPDQTVTAETNAVAPAVSRGGGLFARITETASPAVVNIRVEKTVTLTDSTSPFRGLPNGQQDELLKRFFGGQMPKFEKPRRPRQSMGQGSGFIISDEGYILTNNHVVGGADNVKVTLPDQREFHAKIVGTDPRTDLAIIKIDGDHLPVLPMGDSSHLRPGEWVLAIGSPFGLPGTVTSGIVSATGRSGVGITDYENFIQTDAAINPGNSGGPLVNMQGQAVGVNTAIFSRTGGYMGIGFAIPINMAKHICDQLIESGTVTRGFLGVAIQQVTPDLAQSFGLEDADGVLVAQVTKDSPADKAGLKPGDVIVGFEGDETEDVGPFRNRVARIRPDSKVDMTVVRDGKRIDLTVTVGTMATAEKLADAKIQPESSSSLGMTVAPVNAEMAENLGYEEGVGIVVTSVESGSPAARAGIRPGTLIKEVNRQPVSDLGEYKRSMEQSEDDASVMLLVQQGQQSRFIVVSREK